MNSSSDQTRQLEALELSGHVDVAALSSQEVTFSYVHLGKTDVTLELLLAFLHCQPGLTPPRTGHIGNWQQIADGRSGATDFNQAICLQGYGYPLIYCFTQTESEVNGQRSGDWVYKPGSIVDGYREPLPLHTWDGERFVPRTRTQSYFCPFVQTLLESRLVSLVDLHWQRMRTLDQYAFKLETSIVMNQSTRVRSILTALIKKAHFHPNTRRALQSLISHCVSLDGRMSRVELRRIDDGYWLDDCYYHNLDDLVNAAMLPFEAATAPDQFFSGIRSYPSKLPILSHLLMSVLGALFFSHRSNGSVPVDYAEDNFILHFHWGARDMAGYPPLRNGYFINHTTIKTLEWMSAALIAEFPEVKPICFGLLPAAVFMLCPSDSFPKDASWLQILFESVGAKRNQVEILEVTKRWHQRYSGSVSKYFRYRFRSKPDMLDLGIVPAGRPMEPTGFRQLTLSQACMIVGALVALEAEAT